jgi:hypothetical protein
MKIDPEILRTCMIACENMAARKDLTLHQMRGKHFQYTTSDSPLAIPGYKAALRERDIYQHAADTVRKWLREMEGDAE